MIEIHKISASYIVKRTLTTLVLFLKPPNPRDKMIVKARILRLGKTLTHIFCEVRSQDTGKLVATANTTFLSDSAGNENNSGKTKTDEDRKSTEDTIASKIGRASCRERV